MGTTDTLYRKIIDFYKELIENGSYRSGDKLPSENEMIEKHKVSRITIIRALKELETMQYIRRHRGKGTFVIYNGSVELTSNNHSPFLQQGGKLVLLTVPQKDMLDSGILSGIEKTLKDNGYYLSVFNSEGSTKLERKGILDLKEQISGCIIIPVSKYKNLDLFSNLMIEKKPFVLPMLFPPHWRFN